MTAVALAAVTVLSGVTVAAARTLPSPAPELPVLHEEVAAGHVVVDGSRRKGTSAKLVDGNPADWVGIAPGFSGQTVYSHGELVYTDHLFDAYGADDGGDRDRLAQLDQLNAAVPETYRLDPIFQADIPGELGAPSPEAAKADEQYGDLPRTDPADLLELRVAANGTALFFLARTTTLTAPDQTAVLVLLDTIAGSPARDVPFNTGIRSATADVAVLLAAGAGRAVDLATGVTTPVTVAADPTGWTNTIEGAVPRAGLGLAKTAATPVGISAATGLFNAATGEFTERPEVGANLANVAFRPDEPVRTWMDKAQAFALLDGTIDPFAVTVDLRDLERGRTDTWRLGPGYFARVFTSSAAISSEGGENGIHQHYGLFVPTAYATGATPVPLTFWLHWRGGKAHSAAAVSPRIMRDFGETPGSLVVSPRGRGSSSWYVGKGQYDVDEVYADATALLNVDRDRVYVSGHSMGGWGSYLLSILHPDRFAAALPVAGPVTQGAWTGLDSPDPERFDCDEYRYDDYSFCYIATNDSDPRTQHTRRLLANLRNVPIGIFQGGADELVPVSGVTRQVEKLVELGYRHRYYLFPNYEHYSHPVVDEWAEGVRYLHQFRRDANPAHVTYIRDMPFERSVESGANQDAAVEGSFDFDHAYWMSELTPVDADAGVARFDGRTLAKPELPVTTVPEAGGPASIGQVGPYAMTGLAWLPTPLATPPAAANGFEATLSGASAVRLDLAAMGVAVTKGSTVTGTVTSDAPLTLRLGGQWRRLPTVKVNGASVTATLADGVVTIQLPAGTSSVVIAA